MRAKNRCRTRMIVGAGNGQGKKKKTQKTRRHGKKGEKRVPKKGGNPLIGV